MNIEKNIKRFCTNCKLEKDISEFPKNKNKQLGHGYTCKVCTKSQIEAYYRTEVGVLKLIYSSHKRNAKLRHNSVISYSFEWFKCWAMKNNFEKLYSDWKSSGYKKFLKPSVDRIDDYGTYTKDNIQLMTFYENWQKSIKDKVEGKTNKQNKAVIAISLIGEEFLFHSIKDASRKTGADSKNIQYCCDGKPKYKTSKGYKWKWA